MTAQALLARVERVRQTGRQQWIARCPAHDDKGPSLSIAEKDDGRVLVHCFAQCSVHEIVTAAGLTFADLFPRRVLSDHAFTPERRPIPALDVLRCIASEAVIVALAAAQLTAGIPLTQGDKERLLVASGRISAAVDLAEGV